MLRTVHANSDDQTCSKGLKESVHSGWQQAMRRLSSGWNDHDGMLNQNGFHLQEKTSELSSKASEAARQAEQKLGEAVNKAQDMSDKALGQAKVLSPSSGYVQAHHLAFNARFELCPFRNVVLGPCHCSASCGRYERQHACVAADH
jgi:ElaB/YqjD/DUF883 family membrane-anchored ribosome-binding protein